MLTQGTGGNGFIVGVRNLFLANISAFRIRKTLKFVFLPFTFPFNELVYRFANLIYSFEIGCAELILQRRRSLVARVAHIKCAVNPRLIQFPSFYFFALTVHCADSLYYVLDLSAVFFL